MNRSFVKRNVGTEIVAAALTDHQTVVSENTLYKLIIHGG
jgi:hypothetical protein